MIEINNTVGNNLIQSIYKYFSIILEDYKKQNPSFKYKLYFGSNYDVDTIQNNDEFNIILNTGAVDKIPTHYVDINGVSQLLYGGYLDVTLDIVNPIALEYTSDLEFTTIKDKQITDNLNVQDEENMETPTMLDQSDVDKIQFGTRLLEGLSLFLTRRNVKINKFDITTRADKPVIMGQFESNVYRLLESMTIMIKFKLNNDIGESLSSGENQRVYLDFGDNEWLEYYEVFDLNYSDSPDNLEFPKSGKLNIQTIFNHFGKYITLSSPNFNLGACGKLNTLFKEGNLKKLNSLKLKVVNDLSTDIYEVAVIERGQNENRDRFGSVSFTFRVTDYLGGE
jgi:hypothetical protein